MEYAQHWHGTCMESVFNMCGICMECLWILHAMHIEFAQNEPCLNHTRASLVYVATLGVPLVRSADSFTETGVQCHNFLNPSHSNCNFVARRSGSKWLPCEPLPRNVHFYCARFCKVANPSRAICNFIDREQRPTTTLPIRCSKMTHPCRDNCNPSTRNARRVEKRLECTTGTPLTTIYIYIYIYMPYI